MIVSGSFLNLTPMIETFSSSQIDWFAILKIVCFLSFLIDGRIDLSSFVVVCML